MARLYAQHALLGKSKLFTGNSPETPKIPGNSPDVHQIIFQKVHKSLIIKQKQTLCIYI